MVSPSMSGMITYARDQVRITARLFVRRAASTFLDSFSCTYGPFFTDLDICSALQAYLWYLRRTMNLSDDFFRFLVR